MPVPRFEAKFTVPGPPRGAVERPRLSSRLEQALLVPLTVVRGPAGSGKTEAVAAWARRASPPPFWIGLDASDRDPGRLAGSLWSALGPRVEGIGERVEGDDAPIDAERAEALVSDLWSAVAALPGPVTLVLDDLDEISGSPADPLLGALVRYLPANLHLVVITSHPVPFPIGRLRLAGQVLEIGGTDLRLRPDETAELLRVRAGEAVPAARASELHHVAEGYVSVVVAASETPAGAATGLPRAEWLREVFASVLHQLRPDQRQFILETAPLPLMTPSLCDSVTGRRDSAAMLAELEEGTLVLVRLDDRGPRYRYHRLLRDVLLDQLEGEDPETLVAAHRATAHWMEAHGDPAGAVDEWLAAGDDQQAWELISQHHVETFFAGRRDVIERWISGLTPQVARVDSRRAIDRAVLMLMTGRPDEAARWADEAARRISSIDQPAPLRTLISFVRAQCHLMWGDLDASLAQHLALDRDEATAPFSHLGASVALIEILSQTGRFDDARRAFADMAPSAPFEGDLAGVLVPGVQASLALLEGRLRDAVRLADVALAHARTVAGIEGIGTESSHWAVGTVLLEQGQVAEAVPSLLAARRVAQLTGLVHVSVRATIALARARARQGHPAEAFAELEAARRPLHMRAVPDRVLRWVDQAEARLLLLTGDGTEAEVLLAGGPATAADSGVTVLRAWSALQRGDRARAQDLLAAGLGPDASVGLHIEADLLRATSVRDPVLVRRHVRRAVHRGAPDGYLTVFLDHREGIVDALRALRAVEPSPYLTDLLFLLDAGENDALVESLTDRELAVVAALRTAMSTEAIAADLGVSINTLKTHVKAVYRKLDASNRTDAVRRAIVLRLIGPEADGVGEVVTTREGGR